MTDTLLANYEKEQALLSEFVRSDSEPNILLFEGEKNIGKSTLIEYCLKIAPGIPSLWLTLEYEGDVIPTLFDKMGRRCGWQNLPHFTHTVAALLEASDSIDDPVWLMGMSGHLRKIGNISDEESRHSRYRLLSNAWFTDVMQFETPVLLAIDAYESATSPFRKWFSEDFLDGAANARQMRIVVAGQEVPEIQTGWGFCAKLQKLKGIYEVEAWLNWAEKVGYHVDSFQSLNWCVAGAQGNPGRIVQAVHSLSPTVSSPIQTKVLTSERSKRIRNNMKELVDLEELWSICLGLGIYYKDLPNHGYRPGIVRELLAYVAKEDRWDDLIQACQAERPDLEW